MARVTIEDCLKTLNISRFDLTTLAASRARQIENGSKPFVESLGDKCTVIALREISEGFMTREIYDNIELKSMMVEDPEESDKLTYKPTYKPT